MKEGPGRCLFLEAASGWEIGYTGGGQNSAHSQVGADCVSPQQVEFLKDAVRFPQFCGLKAPGSLTIVRILGDMGYYISNLNYGCFIFRRNKANGTY